MRIIAIFAAAAALGSSVAAAQATTVSKSVDVNGTPAQVWAAIGPFCAIKDWHPAIGACTEDGKTPPTRTLVTKDGKGTFIEEQTARNDGEHSYSYAIKTSPLPLTGYGSTLKVVAKGSDQSTITWTSSFKPNAGQDTAADTAVAGIYQSGLDAIKSRMAK